MESYLFKLNGSTLVPHPTAAISSGAAFEADGKTLLTLEQAVAAGLGQADALRDAWRSAMGPLFETDEPEVFFEALNRKWRNEQPAPTQRGTEPPRFIPPPPPIDKIDELNEWTLRHHVCVHLTDSEYAVFRALCAARSLSPLRGDCFPSIAYNPDTDRDEVVVGTTIAYMRRVAAASGDLEGISPPQWCGKDGLWVDVWLDEEKPPHAARVIIKKRGQEPIHGIAYYRRSCRVIKSAKEPQQPTVTPDQWKKDRAAPQLAKCAQSDAFRQGWPELLSSMYTPDELVGLRRREDPPDAPTQPADPAPDTDARAPAAADPDSAPQTRQQFELAMIDIGVTDAMRRAEIIKTLQEDLRLLWRQNPDEFWHYAWDKLQRDPRRYGVHTVAA